MSNIRSLLSQAEGAAIAVEAKKAELETARRRVEDLRNEIESAKSVLEEAYVRIEEAGLSKSKAKRLVDEFVRLLSEAGIAGIGEETPAVTTSTEESSKQPVARRARRRTAEAGGAGVSDAEASHASGSEENQKQSDAHGQSNADAGVTEPTVESAGVGDSIASSAEVPAREVSTSDQADEELGILKTAESQSKEVDEVDAPDGNGEPNPADETEHVDLFNEAAGEETSSESETPPIVTQDVKIPSVTDDAATAPTPPAGFRRPSFLANKG